MTFLFTFVGESTFLPSSNIELPFIVPDDTNIEYLKPCAILELFNDEGVRLINRNSQRYESLPGELA